MPDSVDKIIKKIPYLDGAFRRRITAGTILLISIYFGVKKFFDPEENIIEKLLSNGSLAIGILALLLVYASGSLIEVIANLFISRIVGRIYFFFRLPGFIVKKIFSLFIRRLSVPRRELDIDSMISKEARRYLEDFPEIIKTGLKNPFGENRETPWDYFCNYGSQPEMHLSRKLKARNQDVLVIMTSMYISFFTLSVIASLTEKVDIDWRLKLIIIASFFYSPIIFFITYVASVKQSLVSLIEFKAVIENKNHINNPYNKSMHPTANTPAD